MKLNDNDCVVILGSGTIAARCLKLLRSVIHEDIYVYEKKQSNSSILEKRLSAIPGVYYSEIGSQIQDEILQINPKMIFSINNVYIFSDELASRFPIINYHNALLPKHPGRNAEAWTIFSQDDVAGVTWHFVAERVDAGNIILQKEIPINADTTSIQLLSTQTDIAYSMFEEIVEFLCKGEPLPSRKQDQRSNIKFHYSWEKPNGGVLDLSWEISQIYAFLRAMDYGKLALLGTPVLVQDGVQYTWSRYSLEPSSENKGISINLPQHECRISKDGVTIKLLGFHIYDGKDAW